MGYLADLAKGEVSYQSELGTIKKPVTALNQRIEKHFLELLSQGGEVHYGEAILAAVDDLFNDFGEYYPTWTPAMVAIFTIAGEDGIGLAINSSVKFLINAIYGDLNTENVHTYNNNDLIRHTRFGASHPEKIGKERQYEVWCTGETVAKIIIDSARTAAVALSKLSTVKEKYDLVADRGILGYVDQPEIITHHVIANRDQAQLRAERGEI